MTENTYDGDSVDVPHELAKAIAKNNLTNVWEGLPPGRRSELADSVAPEDDADSPGVTAVIDELLELAKSKH